MMRGLLRLVGYVALAGAFIAFVVDGARYVANNAWSPLTTGAAIDAVLPHGQSGWETAARLRVSAFLWDLVAMPLLELPFFLLALVIAVLFLLLGRKPKKLIGYSSRE